MMCAETMRVQALFDGELDSISAAQAEQHLMHCEACRTQFEELRSTRELIRECAAMERASPQLRARILAALDAEGEPRHVAPEDAAPRDSRHADGKPRHAALEGISRRDIAGASAKTLRPRTRAGVLTFWSGALSGLAAAAAGIFIWTVLLRPPATDPLVDALVTDHVGSLMSAHLTDVVSTDHHTVKPWFAGRINISPAVADFAAQGFTLVGGRIDAVGADKSAVVVYRHGAHVINVFSWAAETRVFPGRAMRRGYHLLFWRSGDLAYCAVSDAGWDELLSLQRLFENIAVQEPGN